MLWKLEGLPECDVRRPVMPTGTNLLGLVKHLAGVEFGYFGDTFGRPSPDAPEFDDADPNGDWVAEAHESREDIVGLYRKAQAHADATIAELALDAPGRVPWWPADRAGVTLHGVLIHMIAETDQHRGHADVVRELIDGTAGLTAVNSNLGVPASEQDAFRARIEVAARTAAGLNPAG
ncbi:MAG: DinB family protein [Streptosporangiales bacterium]|nr:DinB family protein [Streptosporangiales bacterium]